MVSTLEQMQVPNGTGPGVRRSKRPLLASRTRCNVLWKPPKFGNKVKISIKVQFGNKFANWCNVWSIEGVVVYGHVPECHVTFGRGRLHNAYIINIRVMYITLLGFASMSVPVYIAEAAPAQIRGSLVTFNQLFITVGILISSVVAGAFSSDEINGWRYAFNTQIATNKVILPYLKIMQNYPTFIKRVFQSFNET